MASCSKERIRTYVASGAIPAKAFVKLDTSSNGKKPTVIVCTSGRAIGISQNDSAAASGDPVEVALQGGGAMVVLAGTVALGQALKATTGGAAIVTASDADYVSAIAVESGVTGDEIAVEVVTGQKASGDAA